MTIAIYSRKSKVTDSGDSITNQIQMCKDYSNKHFDDFELIIYEDEGFSGSNTDRPMFKKLITDIKNTKIDVLVCYRLDRISRNVADFSETLELLSNHNVGFISIKEQFDTTTPMGKAMMYIASVFAQLERDTIAERIKDNLYQLAKAGSGRYLNGTAPEGFEKIQKHTHDGKKYNILQQVPEEADKIKLIFNKYIELQSLNKVETYLLQNDIRTRQNCKFSTEGVNRILRHPIYAVADEDTYEYFKNLGTQFSNTKSEFDGTHGINVFRRSGLGRGAINKLNDPGEWVLGVGVHEGIINAKDWMHVQGILESRCNMGIKKAHSHCGLLNGILKCKVCGDYMRPYSIRTGHNGRIIFYYICQTKEISRKHKCQNKNIRGDVLDKDVLEMIQNLLNDSSSVKNSLENLEKDILQKEKVNEAEVKRINKLIKNNEKALQNLLNKLAKESDDVIEQHIRTKIKELDKENKSLKIQLAACEDNTAIVEIENINASIINEAVDKVKSDYFDDSDNMLLKRSLFKTIIKNIYWDGKDISIELI